MFIKKVVYTIFLAAMLFGFQGCNDSDDKSAVPAAFVKSFDLVYEEASSGLYTNGQEANLTVASNGDFLLATDASSLTLSGPTLVKTELIWTDSSNSYTYSMSNAETGVFNELNVFADGVLRGSFVEADPSAGFVYATAIPGSHDVTAGSGTHNRKTIVIAANGDIDFDTSVQITTSQIVDVTDNRNLSDPNRRIIVNLSPYPTQPHPRVEFYFTDSDVFYRATYFSAYSGVNNPDSVATIDL